jgi:N-acetylglucosaminyldiphosphoundecaprenol N-acetyl-beta-D-mannosaminyltransferase
MDRIRHAEAEGTGGAIRLQADFGRDAVCLLGVPFDRVSLGDAKAKVSAAVAERRRCHVATPNLNLMRMADSDGAFRRALTAADLSVADGMPLVWMSRLMSLGIRQRAAGSDLFEALANERGRPVRTFFFGGTDDVCSRLSRKFGGRTSGVRCVGTIAPGFGTAEDMSGPEALSRINAARPDLVVVAVSARKGLDWIRRNERRLAAPVIANLGATIHFAAGTVRRAPERWRRFGLEWLWRIRQEPSLAGRYAADAAYLARVLALNIGPAIVLRLLDRRATVSPPRVSIEAGVPRSGRTMTLSGDFTEETLGVLREALSVATRTPGPLVIDIDGVRRLDATALGLLLVAEGHLARTGERLSIRARRRRLRMVLRVHGCGFLLDAGGAGASPSGSRASARAPLPASGRTAS